MTKAFFYIFLSDHDTDEPFHFPIFFFVFNWASLLTYESIFFWLFLGGGTPYFFNSIQSGAGTFFSELVRYFR